MIIGERLPNQTKYVRCFYQDVLIIGTVQQDYLVVIIDVFLGSTQLRRIFLTWGAAPFNCTPIVLQIIYVLHDLVSYETAATDNGKSYSILFY